MNKVSEEFNDAITEISESGNCSGCNNPLNPKNGTFAQVICLEGEGTFDVFCTPCWRKKWRV